MAQPKQSAEVTRRRVFMAGILAERVRVLNIIRTTPRADLQDGRDLVVRTDVIRKVEHDE